MNYKIVSTNTTKGIVNTTIEFEYDNEVHSVEVSHFRPASTDVIHANIVNRLHSEVSLIEAEKQTSQLNITLNENVTAVVLPSVIDENNPYSSASIDELNAILSSLSAEYEQAQALLVTNASNYDLVVAKKKKRQS